MGIFKTIKNNLVSFFKLYKEATHYPYDKRYYYKISEIHKNKQGLMLTLQVRGKRTAKKLTLTELLTARHILNEIHPFEACVIGILSYSQTIEAMQLVNNIYQKFSSRAHCSTSVKFDSVLEVYENVNLDSTEVFVLPQNNTHQETKISFAELLNQPALLCGLGPEKACYIGYQAATHILTNPKK